MTTKSPAATLAEIAESLKRREAELTGQPAPAAAALNVATVQAFVRDLDRTPKAPVTWFDLALAFLTLQRAVVALSQRCAQLEARPAGGVGYAGTFDPAKSYPGGVLLTRAGGLWLTLRATTAGEKPGQSDGFRLVVKSREG